ncbi:MAG: hypothetical protein HYZ54_10075 [Ignavibacteriae bacterium]|nr:hypothetical protein [Ignavibacteriota bacterium]
MITWKNLLQLIVILCIAVQKCEGKEDKPVEGIVVGINGTEYVYYDIGYCFGKRTDWFSSEMLKGYGGLTVGMEISKQDKIIIAPKMAYSINMFLSFGVNVLYYTDLTKATLQFRPEIGASAFGIRAVFGRNFSVGNYEFKGVNKNNYAITVLIPL